MPTSDFRLLYDVGRGKVSTRVLSYRPDEGQDGYFLLLASPEIKAGRPEAAAEDGDVRDRPLGQHERQEDRAGRRRRLKYVLNNLREGDLFNIIAYDNQVESFRPELQRFNDETRKAALGFVEGSTPAAAPNIDAALRTALGQLQDPKRPNYVIFLTDGLPTAGETNEMKIVANAKEENKVHARIFAFGVGYDVNSRLLDKLARENFGQSEYVRPNEDIEDRVSKLYQPHRVAGDDRRAAGVRLRRDARPRRASRSTASIPRIRSTCSPASNWWWSGRYKKAGHGQGDRQRLGGRRAQQKFDFPATLVEKSSDETLRLHREALGRPPRGRNPRRAGPEGQERGTGQGAGRPGHAARHPHALHLVHGRRQHEPARRGRQYPA